MLHMTDVVRREQAKHARHRMIPTIHSVHFPPSERLAISLHQKEGKQYQSRVHALTVRPGDPTGRPLRWLILAPFRYLRSVPFDAVARRHFWCGGAGEAEGPDGGASSLPAAPLEEIWSPRPTFRRQRTSPPGCRGGLPRGAWDI